MILTGLLGFPVKHSVSPLIHSMFMDCFEVAGEYNLFSVLPEDLKAVIESLGNRGYTGLNVTVPHKKAAFNLCDSTGPDALSTQAVNTLIFSGNGIEGANTDVAGFRKVAEGIPEPYFILGNGGAAAAVHLALGFGKAVRIGRGETLPLENLPLQATVVNATPLGWKDDDVFPFDVPEGWVFADLNYNPRWNWRNQLEKRKVRVVTGEAMVVEQAACAFSLWTGYTPSEELKKKVLKRIRIEFDEHDKQ